ncbi:unnamed protein product [Chrysodeixis includens]|uniref:Gustatory receptor n=1 Tax=Chrysodeixis includens TaxID=689277 RepID=A0A9N8KTX9_CHRIL|nr:unnamed protein product [Chrysodeixis includens]
MKVYQMTISKSDRPCNLQMCLRHALRLGRWAGFFPVQGLGQTAIDGTGFKMKCFYSIYYIATIVGQVSMIIFTTMWFFENEVTLTTVSYIMFYLTSLVSAILLLKLAKQWSKLMKKAKETEQILTEVKLDNRAVLKSSIIAYVAMALALVEHILCTNFNVRFVMNCLEESSITTKVMENYVVHRMPYIFYYVPYSVFTALLFEANVSWAILRRHYSSLVKLVKEIDDQVSSFILLSFFTDLFFICLQLFNSLHALTSADYFLYYLYSFLFLVLRALMLSLFAANVHCVALETVFSMHDVPPSAYDDENYMPASIWGALREDYTRATRLVRLFDDVISPIVLVAFANDLFFVCGQLFNVLVLLGGYEYPIYLIYSLVFLCGRFIILSLATSGVNSASVEPLTVLYSIPSSAYSKEVASTIVTYELVLLQFSSQ